MTTKEKAKAYDEALEKARKRVAIEPQDHTDAILKDFFPQLRESEDEIRKNLVDAFTEYKKSGGVDFHGIEINTLLAWLEKQKYEYEVFEPVESTLEYKMGFAAGQKEQKPVEYLPKQKVFDIMNKLTNLSYSERLPIDSKEYVKIHEITSDVNSLLDYPIKPVEWSEEDKAFLKVAIAICNRYSHKDIADWLKSLRPQPKKDLSKIKSKIILALHHATNCADAQNAIIKTGVQVADVAEWLFEQDGDSIPHWKPTEEQMKALQYYAENMSDDVIKSLYNDLKKLM